MNHPNRGTQSPSSNPSADAIRAARAAAGLTQAQASELVYTTPRNWQHWEAGDRRMHPAIWELWQIKAVKLLF
jgi:putative transcriptional regulator